MEFKAVTLNHVNNKIHTIIQTQTQTQTDRFMKQYNISNFTVESK